MDPSLFRRVGSFFFPELRPGLGCGCPCCGLISSGLDEDFFISSPPRLSTAGDAERRGGVDGNSLVGPPLSSPCRLSDLERDRLRLVEDFGGADFVPLPGVLRPLPPPPPLPPLSGVEERSFVVVDWSVWIILSLFLFSSLLLFGLWFPPLQRFSA